MKLPPVLLASFAAVLLAVLASAWLWAGTAAHEPWPEGVAEIFAPGTSAAAAARFDLVGSDPLPDAGAGPARAPVAPAHRSPARSAPERDVASHEVAPATVEVRVRDELDRPLPDVEVRLVSNDDASPRVLRTDGRGNATFEDLRGAFVQVDAAAEGRLAAAVTHVLTATERRVSLELVLRSAWTSTVRFVDRSGAPLDAARLGLERREHALLGLVLGATCAEVGAEYVPRGAPVHRTRARDASTEPWTWDVVFTDAPTGCAQAVFGEVVVGTAPFVAGGGVVLVPVDADAILELLTAIDVRVVSQVDGAPIEGASVSLGERTAGGGMQRTDARGVARFERIHGLGVQVLVRAAGHVDARAWLDRPFPREHAFELAPGRTIAGRFANAHGLPSAGAPVGAFDLASVPPSRRARPVARTTCDADGAFRIDGLPPGRYAIAVVPTERRDIPFEAAGAPDVAWADCTHADARGVVLNAFWNPPVAGGGR